jgi:hypothetical protein
MHDLESIMLESMLHDSFLIEWHCASADTEWIPKADYKAHGHRHPMNRLPIRPGLPFE